eukprot:9326323-Pyramimonas_sp.AAC.1
MSRSKFVTAFTIWKPSPSPGTAKNKSWRRTQPCAVVSSTIVNLSSVEFPIGPRSAALGGGNACGR